MDKKILKAKLKKYLFFVSIVFFSITLVHLTYKYIYSDSIQKAQKWWTVSESFIGKFPSLNPLKYYNDNYNSYINHILYRSLSSYDINKKTIVSDLAECNITNTQKIECNLTKNIKWSNWDNITTEDIAYTYETIKKYNTNPILKKILDNISIKTTDTSITFNSNQKDISILNILFQPILPKQILENKSEDELHKNFSALNWIYSWNYIISKISDDKDSWNMKIFLTKNEMYIKNPVYIENIILKFYDDYNSLLKQKNNINIFLDKNHLIWNSIPKLQEHKYILPQYVWLFINKDKLEYPKIRNFILNSINKEKLLEKIWKQNNKIINSLFLNDIEIKPTQSKTSLKTMLNSLWYFKKEYFLKKYKLIVENPELYSAEANIISKSKNLEKDAKKIDITQIKNSITKQNYNSDSKIIIEPKWVDKYNFITKPNIKLIWKVDNKNVSEIYINNEKANYNSWEKEFSYELKLWKNIKLWENNYKIYFVENWKKNLKEEITFFYSKDKQKLKKDEIDLIARLINNEIKKQKELLSKKESQNKQKANKQKIVNTKKAEEIKSKIKLLESLDDKFYYNKDFKAYSLNLVYLRWSEEIKKTADFVKNSLENLWIKINLEEKKVIDIAQNIKDNKENYHMILAWINLSYFPFDLSKYFYSGQISKWQNFAKIRNSKLDDILEDLNSSYLLDSKIKREKQQQINNIIKDENIFIPLYSPYYSNLVLKNIENYKLTDIIPKHFYRFEPLKKSYILKEKVINKDNKSIFWFFSFLINKLF